ncbi:glycosyltransferase family 2 protein [Pseudoalteromonas sp. NZS11]|uniref:glycosyltransferase family 2 protein n=1 Tax=Pseudoalteromonas sp. NZS11 TaxID=2792049 RepID=UPI0018CE4C95|nr:glycosyltransferase family 2 protein [Pseudoalteromonas sp. NZS11]MBH0080943.1 glycosyltransferase family 2 protein [Pseudoalteromonas sp. NZS11]
MLSENTNEIVSIITPVYNGMNFIEKCFECIKNQTYTNIEWVVINDGSQDSTLLQLYKLKRKNIDLRIIDQKNSGAAEARRVGALQAKGDYIVYLDIDDSISADAIKLAMNKFTSQTNVVLFNQIKVGDQKSAPFDMFTQQWPQSGENVFKACIDGWGAHSFGVYKKSIFINAYKILDTFENLSKTYKDELLSRIIFIQSEMIDLCEGKYFYDLNDASVSKKFNSEYFLIANNAHALNSYLNSADKNINIERMYSRLFFDILGRYISWHKKINNKTDWFCTLIKLVKKISLKNDIKRSLKKSTFKKLIARTVFILTFKILAFVRRL